MITLEDDVLNIRCPSVHIDAHVELEFQRTLRIPDDDGIYSLPAGLGRFPIRHVEDFSESLGKITLQRGGVIMPMHSSEAMWINFRSGHQRSSDKSYPFAIKVAAGKINALTGEAWSPLLSADPQDYIVIPEQPWIDGFAVSKGIIRQFVAEQLGKGFSVEEQLTGEAKVGGLQIVAYPMKSKRYLALRRARQQEVSCCMMAEISYASMGLGGGGRMRQEIYADPYGIGAWDQQAGSRCFVHLVDAGQWSELTGCPPLTQPLTKWDYEQSGLPWFDYYAPEKSAISGSKRLAGLKSWAAKHIWAGRPDGQVSDQPIQLGTARRHKGVVSEGISLD
ncbi:hypothetical protein [Asticcacaulis sp. AC402]|uniref:hypothetical protein n=1 Tax=Asticcacaulis sp. AC402 TaxID=1282361 RepID=UPI0012DC8C13|nr:hypothetical protein [Asticcacaulis sp. AC402]